MSTGIYRKRENQQYSKEYPEKDNISIDILNDDCLAYVFRFFQIDCGQKEMSIHYTYTLFAIDFSKQKSLLFFSSRTYIYIYIYICIYI